jgi:ankyrin repeat protein
MSFSAPRFFFAFLLAPLLVVACSEPAEPTISLYRAVHAGDLDQVKRNLHWGADVDQLGPDGERPLHVAAAAGRYILVELLLKEGADLDAVNRDGHSPLYVALMARRTRVAEELVAAGAQFEPSALLRELALNDVGDRDAIRLLLAQGAEIDQADANGDTALHLAVRRGYRVVVKYLIKAGADVNAVNGAGATPLAIALDGGSPEIIDMLQRNGAVAEP